MCGTPGKSIGTKWGSYARREFRIRQCPACRFTFIADPWRDYRRIYSADYYAGLGSDPLVDYIYELEQPDEAVRRYEWRGMARAVQSLYPLKPGSRWLDFGCGNGGLVRYVREQGICDAAGFDEGWIESRVRDAKIPMVSAAELDDLEGTFDVVSAIEVLEHVEDPIGLLRRIRALLKPGGLFFFTTGNPQPVRDILNWRYLRPEIHVSYFEPSTAALALERAGFDVEFRGFLPGFVDVIRFKALKNLGIRKSAWWQNLLPWSLLSRLLDAHYRVMAHPIGWAPNTHGNRPSSERV